MRATLGAILVLTLISPAGHGETVLDYRRNVCGVWEPTPHHDGLLYGSTEPGAACGSIDVRHDPPTCTGQGAEYRCTIVYRGWMGITGTGLAGRTICQTGWIVGENMGFSCFGASGTRFSVTYGDIPSEGRFVDVHAGMCLFPEGGGASECVAWTPYRIYLPPGFAA